MNPLTVVRDWFQDPVYRTVVTKSAIVSAGFLAAVFVLALAGH